MLIYVIICCFKAQGAITCICILICICIYIIVFYFVFSAVFIGEGQNLTISFTFWPFVYWFVYINSKLLNTFENLKVFAFVFFHTILTVAQNTQMAYYTILPECYSVYLVIFTICASPGGCSWAPTGGKYPNCPPNRGISSKSLVFGLKAQ